MNVAHWEGMFAKPGIGYDAKSGYTYDGHPLNYSDGSLYGEPHLFSAPSKESIHVAILALAISGNKYALEFAGGFDEAIKMLELKYRGYDAFNKEFPGYGCWTPWVGFNTTTGTFSPLESWSVPYYKVPGLDNGEWFWSLYAVTLALESLGDKFSSLASKYRSIVECQKSTAKMIYYRGNGDVSATVYILNASASPSPSNYKHCDGYLNDPYEGETMTQLLYLYAIWTDDEAGRELLWIKKRALFERVDYVIPSPFSDGKSNKNITVQRGWWFSTHEQWKTLLLPYLSDELPLIKKVFSNAEKARTWDAYLESIPGLFASVNDVTDGSEDIPDYSSACGVASIAFEEISRRDIVTPYGSFGLFLHQPDVGYCWYNNMLSGPRMQSSYGSTEAININGTEISPLVTWDSKITTVLAMLGGVGDLVKQGLRSEADNIFGSLYHRFVYIVDKEHRRVFGSLEDVLGDEYDFVVPNSKIPNDQLSDWQLDC